MFYVHVAAANAATAMPDMTRWLCCESDTDKNDVDGACCPAMAVYDERTDFDNLNVGIPVLRSDSAAATAAAGSPGPTKSGSRSGSGSFLGSWALAEETADEPMVEKPEIEVKDGARYAGQWRGRLKHGQGTLVRPDGSKYEGSFALGWAEGHGRFTSANGDVYDGEWRRDRAHGFGKFAYEDGSVYEGEWQQDEKSGKGVERFGDGSDYKGEFLHGKKHGAGLYRSAAGAVVFEGQFRDDAMDGDARNDGTMAVLEQTDVVCGMNARLPETSLRWSSSLRPKLLLPQKPLGWNKEAAFSISRAGSAPRLPSGPPMWKPFKKSGKKQKESTDTNSTNASTPPNGPNGTHATHGIGVDYARMVSWHRQASGPM